MEHAEWKAIGCQLEPFHELFSVYWELSQPVSTDAIPTAAIQFGDGGRLATFLINPEFWADLPSYDRLFVVCHEVLHVALNHGVRSVDLMLTKLANIAADLAVNHTLTERFGFQRALLRHGEELCWEDTVFPTPLPPPVPKTMEQYYQLLRGPGVNLNVLLLDTHLFPWLTDPNQLREHEELALDALGEAVRDLFGRLGPEGERSLVAGKRAQGTFLTQAATSGLRPVDWVAWVKSNLRWTPEEPTEAGWVAAERRFAAIDRSLMMPGIGSTRFTERRREVALFVDASGSTAQYWQDFLGLALSLPPTHFDVRLYSFDCLVYEIDLKRPKLRGGGGTSFGIMEAQLRSELHAGRRRRYPDAVVVLTDGYGDTIKPKHPDRWHWVMTTSNTSCIPPESKTLQIVNH